MSQRPLCLVSTALNLLTIQDVLLDSPTWRAYISHKLDQTDQFEKWIDGFLRALKTYIDSCKKCNKDGDNLSKKVFFTGLDGTLIDSKIAGNVVSQFATALQAMVVHKMKTVSDLEDQIYIPLQQMVKNDLKSFKESRKQFEKVLEKYEAQLTRFYSLSKNKEASALREDAFQMYETRKLFVKNTCDYFTISVLFKANLENLLVECFSTALGLHVEETDESLYNLNTAKSSLPGWKQWLEESRNTCNYQIEKLNKRCNELKELYLEQIKPNRALKRYSSIKKSPATETVDNNEINEESSTVAADSTTVNLMKKADTVIINKKSRNKEGYLNCRITPTSSNSNKPWIRKWVFLQSGWLGTCTVHTVNKEKGCIALTERVNIKECEFKVSTDIDRNFCFQVTHSKYTYYLQAENEQDMQQWLWAIENNMDKNSNDDPDQQSSPGKPNVLIAPQALLSPNAVMSSVYNTTSSTSSSPRLINMSSSPLPSPDGSQTNKEYLITPIVSTTTSSLTDLLIREGSQYEYIPPQTNTDNNTSSSSIVQQISSWGMPWLPSGLTSALSNSPEEDVTAKNSPNLRSSSSSSTSATTNTTSTATNAITTGKTGGSSTDQSNLMIVWPTKLEMDVARPSLSHYTSELVSSHKELRVLFANVPKDEIVLDSFLASLYRKPTTQLENEELDTQSYYGYSGQVYVTQKSLWFYSCTLMTCVNMLVVPLKKIESVRLETSTEHNNNSLMMIDVAAAGTDSNSPSFSFGLWLESHDVILERLKAIVDNVKKNTNTDVQAMYDTIRKITQEKLNRQRKPTSHVTTSSTLYASVTPVNVQAHHSPMQKTSSSSTNGTNEDSMNEEENESSVHAGSPAQGALAAVFNAAKKNTKKSLATTSKRSSTPTEDRQQQASSSNTTAAKEEWPSHIQKPKGEVKCNCNSHLDKIESDTVLPISAKQMYDIMSQKDLWNKLNKAQNYGEPTITEWVDSDADGVIKERTMSYIMPVSSPMVKAKETDVTETQQVLEQNEYISYVIMMMTRTPNLPYGDAFVPCIKYCIIYVGPTKCRLVCSIGVNWLKSIFVKGMVNNAATKGMQETINKLLPVLQKEVSKREQNNASSSNTATTKTGDNNQVVSGEKSTALTPQQQQPSRAGEVDSKLSKIKDMLVALLGFTSICFMIYQWYKSKQYENNLHHYQNYDSNSTTMMWRGIYLRDIQNEITEKEAELSKVNYNTYRLFQDATKNSITQQWKQPWYSKEHKIMAEELGFSRERLGSIRYELLSTFRILNNLEYQLLESEYWNWLGDQKLKCRQKKKRNSNTLSIEQCKEIESEIARDA